MEDKHAYCTQKTATAVIVEDVSTAEEHIGFDPFIAVVRASLCSHGISIVHLKPSLCRRVRSKEHRLSLQVSNQYDVMAGDSS